MTQVDELASILGSVDASSPAIDTAAPPAALKPTQSPSVNFVPEKENPDSTTIAKPRAKSMLEEIVVTAQRREQSLQDVPMSITVLDAKQIANANITNASDLAAYTPSMSTNQRFGADNATFSIRGFTQELRTTSSVATYMAEVVAPRGQSSQPSGDGAGPGSLFDLANVQVLKGPQGTLFGRNTTGGAVLLTPNKPKDEFEGYVEVSGSERNGMRTQGAVSLPVSETLKFRIAIDKNKRDGYINNVTKIGTDKLASVDYTSVRLSSVWDIADEVNNYTVASYINSNSTGSSGQLFACNPNTVGVKLFLLFSGLLQAQPCQAQLNRQAAAGKKGFYDNVSTIPDPMTAIKEKRLINTLTWNLTEDITLKNILAYAHLNTKNGTDIFGTQFTYSLAGLPLDPDSNREFKTGVSVLNPTEPVTSQASYVGELQLQGQSFDDALQWQGGVYYETSRPDGYSGNNSAGLVSCNMASLLGDGVIKKFDCYDPLEGVVGGVLVQHYKTTYLNRAVYSQATWHINEQFSVTGGLRYTWDRTEGYGIKTRYGWAFGFAQAPTTQITTPKAVSKAPTGLLEVDYKPFDGTMVYGKYVRGYRQGSVILASDPGIDTFKPEKVDTYEIGLKTEFDWMIPGRINLAAFTNDFSNQQLQLGYVSPTSLQTTTIVNAGKSRIRGVEGDAYFQILESLTLGFSFSLLDTKLLKQEDQTARVGAAGGPIAQISVVPIADVGDELPYAPKQTYVTNLTWRLPVPEKLGNVDFGATYSAIGQQRSAASSSGPFGLLDSFNLLNLNLAWNNIFNTSLDVVVFGTNVLGEKYTTYTSGTYNLLGFETRSVGSPRLIGARLRCNFGNVD
ncbi:TonB-dependent receptor [Stenotrophobium rhamnosiphilum]|uniref:TonB-dependent receptor n=1 Tax=Stenotrophobium rhamnosiphilum TaxID=2029166 RepID=UPI001374C61C|nr:TonB-dependent receptor [Stenotrophobium rhamnosiphilum]